MSDKNNGIGAMVKVLRRQAHMTQGELAELCGLSRASITNIELGNQTLSVQTINAIASALGYEVQVRFVRPKVKPAVDTVENYA